MKKVWVVIGLMSISVDLFAMQVGSVADTIMKLYKQQCDDCDTWFADINRIRWEQAAERSSFGGTDEYKEGLLAQTVCYDRCLSTSKVLVEKETSLNKSVRGFFPLERALKSSALQTAYYLLQHNATAENPLPLLLDGVNSMTTEEDFRARKEIFKILLERNVPLNTPDKESGETPLMKVVLIKQILRETGTFTIRVPSDFRMFFASALLLKLSKKEVDTGHRNGPTALSLARANNLRDIADLIEMKK